jgi:hypothetical protein
MKIPTKAPSTIKEAAQQLFDCVDLRDAEFAKNNNHAVLHHGFGTNLRNTWRLHDPKSPLVADVKKTYNLFAHGDDVSGLIMVGLWALIRGKDIDDELTKTAKRYREHWIRCRIDPVTGEDNRLAGISVRP